MTKPWYETAQDWLTEMRSDGSSCIDLEPVLVAAQAQCSQLEVERHEFEESCNFLIYRNAELEKVELRCQLKHAGLEEKLTKAQARIAELESLITDCDNHRAEADANGRDVERTAIVRWLRAEATNEWIERPDSAYAHHINMVSYDIERGEHHDE